MMTSDDLSLEQATKLHAEVFAMWKRLNQFKSQIQKRNFKADDPFRVSLEAALNQMWNLRIFLMYLEINKSPKPDLEEMRRVAEANRQSQEDGTV